MNKFKILTVALLIIPLISFTTHKYYVSSTEIKYKKENEALQIIMRIFIDDLQESINKTYNKNFEFAVPDEPKEIDTLINTYISKNFRIKINASKEEHTYLGKEYKNDVVYLYIEVKNIKTISTIEVKNSMLMEEFPDQKNIIKLEIGDIKKTFLLTKDHNEDLLKFWGKNKF